MSRGKPNKRYTPEFKKLVVETMMEEKLSYCKIARRFEVSSATQVRNWERIYLSEGSEALAIERRGRGSSGRPRKLPKEGGEDLLAEVLRLRAENEYLKNLQALVLEDERRQHKNAGSSEAKAKIFSQSLNCLAQRSIITQNKCRKQTNIRLLSLQIKSQAPKWT